MATSIQGDHSKKLSTVQFIAEMCIACAKYRGEYLPDTWDTFISAVAAKSPEFGPCAKVVFASKCTVPKRVPILGTFLSFLGLIGSLFILQGPYFQCFG